MNKTAILIFLILLTTSVFSLYEDGLNEAKYSLDYEQVNNLRLKGKLTTGSFPDGTEYFEGTFLCGDSEVLITQRLSNYRNQDVCQYAPLTEEQTNSFCDNLILTENTLIDREELPNGCESAKIVKDPNSTFGITMPNELHYIYEEVQQEIEFKKENSEQFANALRQRGLQVQILEDGLIVTRTEEQKGTLLRKLNLTMTDSSNPGEVIIKEVDSAEIPVGQRNATVLVIAVLPIENKEVTVKNNNEKETVEITSENIEVSVRESVSIENNQISINGEQLEVLPDEAFETLNKNNDFNSSNLTIESKEGLIYSIEENKKINFLGIFPIEYKVRGTLNANTGKALLEQPFWAFLI